MNKIKSALKSVHNYIGPDNVRFIAIACTFVAAIALTKRATGKSE